MNTAKNFRGKLISQSRPVYEIYVIFSLGNFTKFPYEIVCMLRDNNLQLPNSL